MGDDTIIQHALEKVTDSIQQRLKDVITQNLHLSSSRGQPLLRIEAHIEDKVQLAGENTKQVIPLVSIELQALSKSPTYDNITSSIDVLSNGSCSEVHVRNDKTCKDLVPSRTSGKSLKRRKAIGGLRPARTVFSDVEENGDTTEEHKAQEKSTSVRHLQSDVRFFPQRRKRPPKQPSLQPSTLDRLIQSVWEQIYGNIKFDPQLMIDQYRDSKAIETRNQAVSGSSLELLALMNDQHDIFNGMNKLCSQITKATRCFRSLEVIIQAHWTYCYDGRIDYLLEHNTGMTLSSARKVALLEACEDFGWTEKHLRNRMAIWRGYRDIKEAAGWVALVFSGMGLYRFCKYRVDFTHEAMLRLNGFRSRFEVAADTLHPRWRQLLSIVGEPTKPKYMGHPHDWVINDDVEPLSLSQTYQKWDSNFSFEHIEDCVLDTGVWKDVDPRALAVSSNHNCCRCGEVQSDIPAENCCKCFPKLYGTQRVPCPVQVYCTADGRNNGLIACCPFERGEAIGEFVGLVTSGVQGVDVMEGSIVHDRSGTTSLNTTENTGNTENSLPHTPRSATATTAITPKTYQIWQGRQGNHTRFVNHSCYPNSQYEQFFWRGVQRIVLVSRGIEAGSEIAVDYSDNYWADLDKRCLCRESCCRYRDREFVSTNDREPMNSNGG